MRNLIRVEMCEKIMLFLFFLVVPVSSITVSDIQIGNIKDIKMDNSVRGGGLVMKYQKQVQA